MEASTASPVQRISVFLADDNLIVREGVRALLARQPDLEVVGVAADYDELLEGAVAAAPQVLVTDIRMPPTFQREGIEAAKRNIREGFKLWLTVTGASGPELTGGIGTVFGSPDFPEDVKSVFFDVAIPLRSRFRYEVSNKCTLFLDFRRPEVLNFAMVPSQPTPNESNFHVHGNDATWVNGVFHEFTEFMRSHRSKMSWLHRHTVYDVVLWILGFPFALWCDARATTLIQKASASTFVQAAFYVYVFFGALVGVRFLFHYARWIWPLVEYRHPRNRALKHKAAWSTIVLGVISSLVYDIAKKLF